VKVKAEMPDRVEVEHDISDLLRRRDDLRRRLLENPAVNV